jgi:uncharacterized protein YndB with AHSA1/START domain
MPDRFVYVTYIRSTPEEVFDGLTKPEFTKAYWNETWQVSEWKKGSAWQIMRRDGTLADSGEILEIDPPRLLRVSWRNEFMPGLKEEGYSHCTYEIEQGQGCVKLTVTHESDVTDSKLIKAVSGGWPAILASLKSLLETGEALEQTKRWPK